MERGAINGIPVWIRLLELNAQERTIIQEAPGIDGALIEPQGQMPQRYRVEFMLIRDGQWIIPNYEAATLLLRAAFLAGGPFTISIPVLGEITNLWMSEGVSLKFFDESRLAISEGSVSFVEGRSILILADDAAALVGAALSALSLAAVVDFGVRVPSVGLSPAAIAVLGAASAWLADVQGEIAAAFQVVSTFASAVQSLNANIEGLVNAPQNFASFLMSTAAGLMSLVPILSQQGDQLEGSAAILDLGTDKPAVVLGGALDAGAVFDSDLPPTRFELLGNEASVEDRAEQDEVESAKQIALVAITSAVCLAITNTNFATINSVIEIADKLDGPFEALFAIPSINYQVYNKARAMRASTLQFLGEQAAGLPQLLTFTTPRDTDLFDVLPDLYEDLGSEEQVQLAVDSLAALNDVANANNVVKGTTLRYLNPLVT